MTRPDGRNNDEMRPVKITTGVLKTAEGSAMIEVGNTHVLCAATIENVVPQWLRGAGKGWVTAEYSMLPRATITRTPREVVRGRQSGRTLEIQRLIGRALRSVIDMSAARRAHCHPRLRRDPGRRRHAHRGDHGRLRRYGDGAEGLQATPGDEAVAGSRLCGGDERRRLGGRMLLDLCYEEDSSADVDMNLVMTGAGRFVELQATAEKLAFDDATGAICSASGGGSASS
jgi:ribonuclease PH